MNLNETNVDDLEIYLGKLLDSHTISSQNALPKVEKISLSLTDGKGVIVGGITGKLTGENFHISLLALESEYYGKGYGTMLLEGIEKIAISKGAKIFTITTLSHQAPKFYQKNGYEIFASLENCPYEGVTKFYLSKSV